MLLVGREKQVLLTNPLYQEVATSQAAGWEIAVPPNREYAQRLRLHHQKGSRHLKPGRSLCIFLKTC